ncbi:cation:proton antiporter [Peptococcaceae bacterium]|nr:cation:proton antiporter [Peptococcaceae bacterium]
MQDVIVQVSFIFLCVFIAVWLASKFKFSSIPFLIVAGMLVGPHAPEVAGFDFSLVNNNEIVELLSRLGILLMLFYLGLEFSLSKLASGGTPLLLGGTLYVLLNVLRGFVLGWFFFDDFYEILIVVGITGISSSAIVTKLLVDLKRTANPETRMILGILIIEDVFIAIYLSVLGALLFAKAATIGQTVLTVLIMVAFILLVMATGRKIGRTIEGIFNKCSGESFVITLFTLLLVTVVVLKKIHVEEVIGALLLGMILAETAHSKKIIQTITPMRELFGAVFFFSFGLNIDYRLLDQAIGIAVVAVIVTVIGNAVAGLIAAKIGGYKGRRATTVAFTIMARGEFTILVAAMAVAADMSPVLSSFAALYVLILAFISPVLAKNTRLIHERLVRVLNLAARNKAAQ